MNSKSARWSPQQGAGIQAARAMLFCGAAGRRKEQSSQEENGNESRLVLGTKRLRPMWRCRGERQCGKGEGRGNKRSAKSEAEEGGSNRTRVRISQPAKKRAK